MTRQMIFDEINTERDYQDKNWGIDFDDKNSINDWVTFIVRYASNAAKDWNDPKGAQKALIKVAALAVAALEAQERHNGLFPKRHYE
jgi:hypothetical protein